jgi:hypothetical protein
MIVLAPISIGELIDKITILEIKMVNIRDSAKLKNVERELDELKTILSKLDLPDITQLKKDLGYVNADLWMIEDFKRRCEQEQDFSSEFIRAARQVYQMNDERARIKREINSLCGSTIVEEKSYANV